MTTRKLSYNLNRIAFYGPMCVGKTWCADYLNEWGGYYKMAFADRLKALAYELFDVQGKDGPSRAVYQQLGAKLREIDENVWVNSLLRRLRNVPKGSRVVIDDLRYLNEAKALKQAHFTLVLVTCPEDVRLARVQRLYPGTTAENHNHQSELEWMRVQPDFPLISDGMETMEDLERLIDGDYSVKDSVHR